VNPHRFNPLIGQAQRLEQLSGDLLRDHTVALDDEVRGDLVRIHNGCTQLVARLQAARELSPAEWPEDLLHSLRSPLNTIVGYAGLLASGDLPDDRRHALTTIHDSGRQLVNDITALFMPPTSE
jgi:signal transduction histidine kinase